MNGLPDCICSICISQLKIFIKSETNTICWYLFFTLQFNIMFYRFLLYFILFFPLILFKTILYSVYFIYYFISIQLPFVFFRFFTKMPNPHYMVEAKLILNTAAEDIPRAEEIRTIIKDIWDIRMAKLRTSMDAFIREGGSYAKLDHLTAMEINSVRPLLPHALDQLFRLQMVSL